MISVIINTYNRKNDLLRAIQSVKSQTFNDLEIIVVDDNSTDGTEQIDFIALDVKYVRNISNLGLAKSREVGLNHSSSDLVAFLDDDDYYNNINKLELQHNLLKDNEMIAVVCSDITEIKGNNLTRKRINWPSDLKAHFLICNGIIYPSTTLVRKSIFFKVGGFDYRFSRGIDSDVYRRIIFSGFKIVHMPISTVTYRIEANDKITDSVSYKGLKKDVTSNLLTLKKYFFTYFKNPKELLGKLIQIIKKTIKLFMVRVKNA